MAMLGRLTAAIIGILALSATAAAEPRLALVIGNADYASLGTLTNPGNDATLMADTLRRVGFDVTALPDLDQRGMKRAVGDFADKVARAGDGAVALFYYAGHGIQVGGINYLIPVDADIRQESDVAIQAMPLPDILNAIEFARASVNIIILDACRDNPVKRSFRSTTRGLARVDAPGESIVAYSTAEGEAAADGSGANSPYTAALAAAIVQPGLPVEQVFKQVGRRVKETTGSTQMPFVSSNLYNDFFFVPGANPPAGVADSPPTLPPSESAATPAAPDSAAEDDYLAAIAADSLEAYREFLRKHPTSPRAAQIRKIIGVKIEDDAWQRATVAGTTAELQKYLTAFPDGPHAAEAERQIAALAAPPPVAPAPAPPAESGNSCNSGDYRVVDIAAGDILSMRSAPGKSYPEIARIPPDGSGITVGSCQSVNGYDYPWCRVSYDCIDGWAYGRYLADAGGNRPGLGEGGTRPALLPLPDRGGETYRVTGVENWDVLNMRSGPGTGYPIVVAIPPDGSGVTVHSCSRVAGFAAKWCRTTWQGYSGWASACCLVGERSGRPAD
jgi:carboxyl-terminal processing protease